MKPFKRNLSLANVCVMHSVENIVAEVTFQFWEFLSIFGQFFALVAIFGHVNIILQGYLNNHIFHTVLS